MNAIEDQARSIFLAAVERGPDEWPALLHEACGGDAGLRARVDQLLNAHKVLGSIHGGAAEALGATVDDPIRERPGTAIGPYKLLEQIGEGGFGVVFMAEQTRPVCRKVALKVLKPGMDTRQVVARFEAERQALALMDHPHIAHVFDGGETASGRPYFVMELVRGIPITDFCDRDQMPVRQRLELFISVCQAVQHAHHKGIIHRDLKPTNVLVTLHDGTPIVKVIDFGIAKATGQRLTEKTLFTNFAQMIGTPLYMSPEQAALSGLDVDTRSDIYSLGVLLYELLTGTTQFDKERLRTVGYDELRRIIREEEPPKPSTRISTVGPAATAASTQRQSDPKHLSRLLRGELDWIVMKCLEKDRNRRYDTAGSLAHDIERYLHDEPVQACPPSPAYRLRKFVRRNRTAVAAALSAVGLLLLAVLGLTVSNYQIAQEQARTKVQRDEAEANFRKACQAVDDQFTLVSQNKLFEAPGLQPLRKELLESALRYYEDFLRQRPDDPLLQAEVAAAYFRLYQVQEAIDSGLSAEAVKALAKGVEMVEKLLHEYPDQDDLYKRLGGFAKGHRNLHAVYSGTGPRADPAVALPLLERASRIWEGFVRDHPAVIELQYDLSRLYQAMVDVQRLSDMPVKTLEVPRRILALREDLVRAAPDVPEYRKDLAESHSTWAWHKAWERRGDFPFAEVDRHFKRELELRKQLVEEQGTNTEYRSALGLAHRSLALWLADNGNFREAEQQFGEMLAVQEKLAAEIPSVPGPQSLLETGYCVLGDFYVETKQPGKAEEAYRNALSITEKLVAAYPASSDYRSVLANRCFSLAPLLAARGRHEEADSLYRKALDFTPKDADGHNTLSALLLACPDPRFRDPARALKLAKKAVELAPQFGYIWNTLGMAHYRAGNWKEAIAALEKSMQLGNGGDIYDYAFLAMASWQLGDRVKAREWYDRTARWAEKNRSWLGEFRRQQESLRAEAAELLGIKEQPPAKAKETGR